MCACKPVNVNKSKRVLTWFNIMNDMYAKLKFIKLILEPICRKTQSVPPPEKTQGGSVSLFYSAIVSSLDWYHKSV